MSFLSRIGNDLRNWVDDAGSVITGAPAHGPAPSAPAPQAPPQVQPNNVQNNQNQPQNPFGAMAGPNPFQQQLANINQTNNVQAPNNATLPFKPVAPPQPVSFKPAPKLILNNQSPFKIGSLNVSAPKTPQPGPINTGQIPLANGGTTTPTNTTNDPVGNFVGSIVKPLGQFPIDASQFIYNKAVAPTLNLPKVDNPQNEPGIVGGLARETGANGSLHQLVGSGIQTGLTIGSGGLDNLIEKGGAAVLPKAAPQLVKNFVPKIVSGAGIGYGFGASSAAGAGAKPSDINKAGLQTAALGAAIPGAGALGEGLLKGAQAASKVIRSLGDTNRTNLLQTATTDTPVQNILVNSLHDYEGTTPDRATVNAYKQQIQSGQPVNPLIALQSRDGSLGVEDGKHRLQAYKELGYTEVPTQITTPEAIANAFGSAAKDINTSSLGESAARIPKDQSGSLPNNIPRSQLTGRVLSMPNSQFSAAGLPPLPPEIDGLMKGEPIDQTRTSGGETTLQHTGPQTNPLQSGRQILPTARSSPHLSDLASDTGSSEPTIPRNPTKVNIPEVNPGDYEKARSNAQLASNPIEYAMGQAMKAAKSTGLSTSEFGKMVEGTEKPKNAIQAEAIRRYQQMTNLAHATSEELGGHTPYRANYFHHEWDLSNPEDEAKINEILNARGGESVDPYAFGGIDRQPRIFDTIQEGENTGFKLKNPNILDDLSDYGSRISQGLKRQALIKGMTEADMNEPLKNHSFDLGNGQTLPLSEKGLNEMRAYERVAPPNKLHSVYRTGNRKLKQTLLSASEFHPINISALKAGPAEALAGHPVLAAKGVYGTFRSQIGRAYSDRLQQSALEDGTVDAAARLGTPIKYGSDYSDIGKMTLGKQGVGERAIFEKAMPAMHIRMVQGLVKDLESKGISLDSPEARKAGDVINKTMGFINTEVKNHNPHVQKALSDLALAPQFTRAKWGVIKDAFSPRSYTKGGTAGKYAASAVVGNTLAATAVSAGLGYLLGQKSDNPKDLLIRNLIHPSVPTPLKDAKGNTIELGLPSTYASEALGLGAGLTRGADGRLKITAKPQNIGGNLATYGRSRLATIPGTFLKAATNTDYAGKPLYDPTVSIGKKFEQGATTVGTGLLPIGGQGLAQSSFIKNHLPQTSQDILNANKPGTDPLLKSAASAIGLTPRTDKTVGKGLQATQYFNALDQAKAGLNPNDKAAFDSIHQQSKDPVTGKYVIQPTVFDSEAKASLYLQHPNVLTADNKLNQQLAAQGQKVDPFFNLSPDKQKAYLESQLIDKNNTGQLTIWKQNNPWAAQFQQDRAAFYNSLPPGDPNKPKVPIQPPTETQDIQDLFRQENALTDPKDKAQFYAAHPELTQYEQQYADYTNKILTAQGLTPLKPVPQADPETASYMATYMAADKATRKSLRTGNPTGYNNMSAFLQNMSEYQVAKNGALDQFQGQTPNQKLLKGINSLATYDMVKNPDGTLALKYGSVNPGATTYGSVAATPEAGATAMGAGSGSGSRGKFRGFKSSHEKIHIRPVSPVGRGRKTRIYARTPKKFFINGFVKQHDTPNFGQEAPRGKIVGLKTKSNKATIKGLKIA